MSTSAGTAPGPAEIAEVLEQHVIGQPEAVQEMAIALAKKLAGLRVGNILMIGSSGTGKTTLMRAVEAYLASDSVLALRSAVVRIHANVLSEEAERGRPGEAVLRRLLERAREQMKGDGANPAIDRLLERAGSGLVFVDEIDKIRAHIGGQASVVGIRAQEALLTLIENESVPFTLPPWAGGGAVEVDSRGLLFVCAGAFEGLYDAVFDRVTIGRDRGALKPTTVVEAGQVTEAMNFSLRDWLRNEDLFDYGMSPQFLSRFDAVVLLRDLDEEALVRIFLETPESGLQQARAYFESRGVHLAVSPAAVRRIVREAVRQKRLGARAMKEVFRRVIRSYEFAPISTPASGDSLFIDVPQVEAALEG